MIKLVNGVEVPMTAEEAALLDAVDSDHQWELIRAERNALLVASDWTQFNDSPLDAAAAAAWATYRQALRDITKQADPANITWPVAP